MIRARGSPAKSETQGRVLVIFGKERYLYLGGPMDEERLTLTHAEDVRICTENDSGKYVADGLGDDNGRFANRRVWTTCSE